MAMTMSVAASGRWSRLWQALVRPRGDRRWDVFLRATAFVGLLGIPTLVLFPDSVPLVWLAVLSLPANSPLSPLLPTFFEPLIIDAAKWSSVWAVTLVACAGYMYMEYLNWHVYAWVLNWDRLADFRARRSVRWGVQLFARSPFWMVVIFAFTPLPFWAGRSLAILHRYPLGRFMLATAVGRVPRWLFYAWFGSRMNIPVWILVGVIVIPAAFVIGGRLLRGQSLLAEVGDAPAEPAVIPADPVPAIRLRDGDPVVPSGWGSDLEID
jgi:membrane protein YqaA with SNARE-associated domain